MITTHAFRLRPGNDLKKEIESFVLSHSIRAGWICCGVGSLRDVHIRYANEAEGSKSQGYFEIVSLMGTLSPDGLHLHISVSDGNGRTTGGHLLYGNLVYTTVEIILQETDELNFTREQDGSTPWKELQVSKRVSNKD